VDRRAEIGHRSSEVDHVSVGTLPVDHDGGSERDRRRKREVDLPVHARHRADRDGAAAENHRALARGDLDADRGREALIHRRIHAVGAGADGHWAVAEPARGAIAATVGCTAVGDPAVGRDAHGAARADDEDHEREREQKILHLEPPRKFFGFDRLDQYAP